MKLSKQQIKELEKALKQADSLQSSAQMACGNLASLIESFTGVDCHVDYLQGDGHGVTPISNNDTHVPISYLIIAAKKGEDIDEDYMLRNLSI